MFNKKHIFILIIIAFVIGLTTSYLTYTEGVISDSLNKPPEDIRKEALENYYDGNLEESEKLYQKLVTNNNFNKEDIYNLTFIRQELGKLQKAIETLHILQNSDEKSDSLSFNLAKLHFQKGNMDKSEEYLKEVYDNLTEANINDREKELLFFYRGKIALKQNKFEKAEKLFEEGINYNSDNPLYYLGKAEVMDKKGNTPAAIDNYHQALKLDYSISNVYSNIAEGYDDLNNEELSYQYWKESLNKGDNKDKAKKRIKILEDKHPQLAAKEEEKKRKEREDINWIDIEEFSKKDSVPEISVGLIDNADNIIFQTNSDFIIKTRKTNITLVKGSANEEWTIKTNNDNYEISSENDIRITHQIEDDLEITTEKENGLIALYNVKYGQGYFWGGEEDRQYRGRINIKPNSANSFNVINNLSLTEYLLSVVPAEMPSFWPEEALKAQTVAARSYTLNNLGRHANKGYDLCANVHCAAYNGVESENIRTNRAVMETRGEVAKYDDEIIDAVFNSNSGGFVENSEEIWGNDHPHLVENHTMKEDDYQFPLSPTQLYKWLINKPSSYSLNKYINENNYRWLKLTSIDYIKERYNLSEIKNIIIRERSKGGTVQKIEIISKDKNLIIKGDNIRSALGGLRSSRFVMEKIYSNNEIQEVLFYGGGFGHSVGLDQSAAAGLAESGNKYEDIIKYFYKDVKISELD
ncbi:MAG: SpoIID/LytB domain-containing protein [Halanaerobiales bacterium]